MLLAVGKNADSISHHRPLHIFFLFINLFDVIIYVSLVTFKQTDILIPFVQPQEKS